MRDQAPRSSRRAGALLPVRRRTACPRCEMDSTASARHAAAGLLRARAPGAAASAPTMPPKPALDAPSAAGAAPAFGRPRLAPFRWWCQALPRSPRRLPGTAEPGHALAVERCRIRKGPAALDRRPLRCTIRRQRFQPEGRAQDLRQGRPHARHETRAAARSRRTDAPSKRPVFPEAALRITPATGKHATDYGDAKERFPLETSAWRFVTAPRLRVARGYD